MLILTKKFIIVCVTVSCANMICATPDKCYFRDRFVTPTNSYEDIHKHPDDYEILERPGFNPEENDGFYGDHVSMEARSEDCPTGICRFKRRQLPPTDETDFENVDEYNSEDEEYSDHLMREPYDYSYDSSYMHPYAPAYKSPSYYNPDLMYPPHDLLDSWQPQHRGCEYCDKERRKKNFDCFNQNIFQIVKFKNDKKFPVKPKVIKHSKSPDERVRRIYFYKKKEGGTFPTVAEIQNQGSSVLTPEQLKVIEKILREDQDRSKQKKKKRKQCTTCKCTRQNIPECTTRCKEVSTTKKLCTTGCNIVSTTMKSCTVGCKNVSTTEKSCTKECSSTTSSYTTAPMSTSTVKPNVSNSEESSEEDSKSSSEEEDSKTSTTCNHRNATTVHRKCSCTKRKPQCKYNKNVILKKVVHSCTPCIDKPKNNSCGDASDNVKFIKINFCDLGDSCNCSSCNCSSEEKPEECHTKKCNKTCKKTPLKDIDYIYYTRRLPDAISPRYDPYFNRNDPWWHSRHTPYLPNSSPCQCDECYYRNLRAMLPEIDERYFLGPGYYEPLNPSDLEPDNGSRSTTNHRCPSRH